MLELMTRINRFRALKNKTGTHKSSSYTVNLHFSPWNDDVTIEWGCYDIGNYPRHYVTTTTAGQLLAHMDSEIDKMERVVEDDLATAENDD